ncbi:BolA/IbaG family iron-sulfur metabolism protein [Enterobacteriaceae endosymbiont of Macroplea mutica]|uniref:BolA family protein n=1 Tax=Enterobacteriaceae endosymbiont of Macroplea mutica TaxID=2675791 RepID=UPI0014490FAB|nr:BolA/IbaG family iron-sulfur metabolism protein [Enterobacteriaceae endosymbiont of Macroplea mutica]QJC31246.1 BolA/IbaG family iron-sulfur metabolism protein [Enterobacteriaceae endosymbiont of Macroplea mutica]
MLIKTIEKKIKNVLNPIFLHIKNNSNDSNVITHLQITIVCEHFTTQNLIQRHRLIYKILTKNIMQQIHAISLNTYSIIEWNNIIHNKDI